MNGVKWVTNGVDIGRMTRMWKDKYGRVWKRSVSLFQVVHCLLIHLLVVWIIAGIGGWVKTG